MKQLRGTPLKRFLRDYRRANPPRRRVAIVVQSVAYPANVGSILRIADAADVAELILTGITPTPDNPTVRKVARHKDGRLNWTYVERAEDAVVRLKEAGYFTCAVELTDGAVPYHRFAYPEKVCLIVGNEDHGVTQSVLNLCDAAVFVPMFGRGRSLNVHVSLAVVCYHVLVSEGSFYER